MIQEQIRQIYREQRKQYRLGNNDDPFDPEARTEEQIELEKKFAALVEEQRALMIKDEFDKIYTGAGGSGMNAGTTNDLTLYFITVPANKLELWFWMESDRLGSPVFREFYSERDVVHEERRMRTESTPTGKFAEQFEAMFWESHPYSWPVVGWPSDLKVISKQQADDYYATYYAPNNLTVAMVGNFDSDEVKAMANKYFGRIPRGETDPPDVVTLEMQQLAEKRMNAECDCQPQVDVRYHTVPFMHADSYALDIMAELLNGRTGRLYKELVMGKEIASSASAGQDSGKYAGSFSFSAETKGDATPAQLESAWYMELRKLQELEIPDRELQKVKNNVAAGSFRRLQNPFFLALQLMFYDGLGDWTYLNSWSEKTLAVTAEDVQRVAKKYFAPENRAVAIYERLAGADAEQWPAGVEELEGQIQMIVKAQIRQLRQVTDVAQLEALAVQLEQQKASAPPEFKVIVPIMEQFLSDRIAELSAADGGEE
jgi:predicted Zn-dependent peptidase